MKNSEILKMLATTKSDDFVGAGEDAGIKTYEVIKLLLAAQDARLLLRALQIAFALGRKSGVKTAVRVGEQCDFVIDEQVSGAEYDEMSTEGEREAHIEKRVNQIRKKREQVQ